MFCFFFNCRLTFWQAHTGPRSAFTLCRKRWWTLCSTFWRLFSNKAAVWLMTCLCKAYIFRVIWAEAHKHVFRSVVGWDTGLVEWQHHLVFIFTLDCQWRTEQWRKLNWAINSNECRTLSFTNCRKSKIRKPLRCKGKCLQVNEKQRTCCSLFLRPNHLTGTFS